MKTYECVYMQRIPVVAENGADHIVVSSPDTDILVLLLYHHPAISAKEIFLLMGRQEKNVNLTQFIPTHQLYNKLEKMQYNILLSVYCCDTVSLF